MKNLTIYRSPQGWVPDIDLLMNHITKNALGYSWKALRDGDPFIRVGDSMLLVSELQRKLLPASVINRELKIRLQNIESTQGYKPGKKQIRDMKEGVTEELYAKAFVTSKFTNVWIDLKNDMLCIDTTSDTTSSEIWKALYQHIGYEGHLLKTADPASKLMRSLIFDECGADEDFLLDRSCVLQDEEGRSIKYKNIRLVDSDEVRKNVMTGFRPKKLAVNYDDKLVASINDNLTISSISLSGIDAIDKSEFETEDERIDAEFALITAECSAFINALIKSLGGDAK